MRVCGGKTGGSVLYVILVTVLLTEGFAKTALGGRPIFRSERSARALCGRLVAAPDLGLWTFIQL